MQPYHRQMSYDSLKSIVPHLTLTKRLELSFFSRIVHGINRRVSFSLSFLKFHQTYSNPDCITGVLFVESVEYSFESNGCHVEISCLGRKRVSSQKQVASRYFEYFLRQSVLPVRQLELIHCQKDFHNFHQIPIPQLKLQRHPDEGFSNVTITGFPEGHKMEEVELIDCRVGDMKDRNLSTAVRIIFTGKSDKHDEFKIEGRVMWNFLNGMIFQNSKVNIQIEMNHLKSFAVVSGILIGGGIEIGSSVTGIFKKPVKTSEMFEELLIMFNRFSPKTTRYNERECVILRDVDDSTMVAF